MRDLSTTEKSMNYERRPIPGYEGVYEIDEVGNIWSLTRKVRRRAEGRSEHWYTVRGQPMKTRSDDHGYLYVHLRHEGEAEFAKVHWLVLLTFVGPRPTGNVGRHLDDNKLHNHHTNLAWGTPQDNTDDSIRNGRWAHGESTHLNKLSEKDAITILELLRDKRFTQTELAKAYNVKPNTIHDLHRGLTWKHLKRS